MGEGRKWRKEAQCPPPTPGSSITIAGASQGLAQPRSPGHQDQKWSSVLGRAKGISVEGREVNGDRQAYRAGSPQAGGLHQHWGPQSSESSLQTLSAGNSLRLPLSQPGKDTGLVAPLHHLLLPDVWVSTFLWSPGGGAVYVASSRTTAAASPHQTLRFMFYVNVGLPRVLRVGAEVFLS